MKQYQPPEIELIRFRMTNVIAASGGTDESEDTDEDLPNPPVNS